MTPTIIQEFLYFDRAQTEAILDQFAPDLIEQLLGEGEKTGDKSEPVRYKRRHELLNSAVTQLAKVQLVTDLNAAGLKVETSPERIREAIGNKPYIKAQGRWVIEDYQRIQSTAKRFGDTTAFLSRMQVEIFKRSTAYQNLIAQIQAQREVIEKIEDRKKEIGASAKLTALEKELETKLIEAASVTGLEPKFISGLQDWIETFFPNLVQLRIFPFEKAPSFQILCNLKRDCFSNQTLEHLRYGYGNRPSVPLTVFGLITSNPPKETSPFNPISTGESHSAAAAIEQYFRTMTDAIEDLENFVCFSYYPNISIQPIAVYREFSGTENGIYKG